MLNLLPEPSALLSASLAESTVEHGLAVLEAHELGVGLVLLPGGPDAQPAPELFRLVIILGLAMPDQVNLLTG